MSAGFRSSSLILQDVRWQLVFVNDAVIPLLTLALGWYVVQVVCGCVAPQWCGMYVWCGMWYVVCVPIVLLSTPQAPILRPNTKPYFTYWCTMPRPCTLVVLKLQHLSDAAWAAFVP